MKNKKLLNFYMLSIALIAIISFLLPIEKLSAGSQTGLLIMIPYYIFSGIMMVSLVIVVIFALINMFKNEYDAVNIMKAFSFIAFVMVLLIFGIFSSQLNYALSWGFILIAFEVFLLFTLISIIKTVETFKKFNEYMQKLFPKKEKLVEIELVPKTEAHIKSKPVEGDKEEKDNGDKQPEKIEDAKEQVEKIEEVKVEEVKVEEKKETEPKTNANKK